MTCGTGTRQRFVMCQVRLYYLRGFVDLADSECPGKQGDLNRRVAGNAEIAVTPG